MEAESKKILLQRSSFLLTQFEGLKLFLVRNARHRK